MTKKNSLQEKTKQLKNINILLEEIEKVEEELGGTEIVFLGSTKEKTEGYLKKVIEIKKNFHKYVSEDEVQRAKQLEELKDSLPKEQTLWERVIKGTTKYFDAFAKYLGQDSFNSLYDLFPFSNSIMVSPPGAEYAKMMNGFKKGLADMKDHLSEKIKDIESEVIQESQESDNIQQKKTIQQSVSQSKDENFSQKLYLFNIEDSIKQRETELGEIWKFTEEGQELYKSYFSAKKSLYIGEGDKILEIQREQNDYENTITKFHQERERAAVEEKYKENKVALKNQLAEGLLTKEQYAQKEEELTISYLENEIALRNSYGKDTIELEEQLADMRLAIREREEAEAAKTQSLAQQTQSTEEESLKTRAEQWQEYAQKIATISQKVSEVTGMVTNSLGGMFSQLSASYAQDLESINGKIAAIDEQKEAALEKVALTEDQRKAREDELAAQKINSEYAITNEQKSKADERIATLQNELGAEDTIKREFEDKKATLEKEKDKKEKAQKKAEKMQKRLEMGQAIVEAIGNIAQGAAKALAHGPILGPILAAVVSTAGAIQVGIMTKQLSKMEDGGFLQGKRHSQGGMRIQGSNIEVEGGEYVVNRQSTNKNMALLSYINEQRRKLNSDDMHSFFSSSLPRFQAPQYAHLLEKGGQIPMLPVEVDMSNSQLLAAIQNIKIQPRVAVTDIMHVHDQMVKVDEWAGF